MKKTIYGDTEILTEPACPECEHRKEDEQGKVYCELYPEIPENELDGDDAPKSIFSIYHGTYGKCYSSNCDCNDFEPLYDGE